MGASWFPCVGCDPAKLHFTSDCSKSLTSLWKQQGSKLLSTHDSLASSQSHEHRWSMSAGGKNCLIASTGASEPEQSVVSEMGGTSPTSSSEASRMPKCAQITVVQGVSPAQKLYLLDANTATRATNACHATSQIAACCHPVAASQGGECAEKPGNAHIRVYTFCSVFRDKHIRVLHVLLRIPR